MNQSRFREPYFTIFNYYKMGRELLRAFCVILLVVLNTIIIKGLQMAKKNRRLLIKRSSAIDSNDVVPSQIKDKQRYHIESKVEK